MLLTQELDEIIKQLRSAFQPQKIVLFGSQIDGEADNGSDVDLLVVAETNLLPLKRYAAASRALRNLPYDFDVIVKTPDEYEKWRKAINHIVYFADKYGKVIYEQ